MSNIGKNKDTYEMSRYIDLDVYHDVERSHPYYVEMMEVLVNEVNSYTLSRKKTSRMLEIGAGTGLATEDFISCKNLEIVAVDLDKSCCELLQGRELPMVTAVCSDATEYCEPSQFDIVSSTFAHDHINYDNAAKFISNIRNNLKTGGVYLMGGEILGFYKSDQQRREALYAYHTFIVNKALYEGNFKLAQIEINALESGLDMVGDFKRHELMFEEEMVSAPFELIKKIKIGPESPNDIGGVFVYAYKAI